MKLRKFTFRDAQRVTGLVGNESVSKWTSNIPFPYSDQNAIDWIRDTTSNPDRHPFAVEVDDEIVACVSYWPCVEGSVEVGYWVGKSYWGLGYATQALSMLISQGFFPRGCDMFARVMVGNIGSERVLQKCGFTFLKKCTIEKSGKKIDGKIYFSRVAT